jgi:hypothetical protein
MAKKTAEFETKEIDENLNQKLSSEKCWLLRYIENSPDKEFKSTIEFRFIQFHHNQLLIL